MSAEAQPWADLVVLAERERDLVRDGRWDEVPLVAEQRLAAATALPDPPAAARPHLERLVQIQAEIHAGLSAGRAFTLQKLGGMNRNKTAMRGYAGPPPVEQGLVNRSA